MEQACASDIIRLRAERGRYRYLYRRTLTRLEQQRQSHRQKIEELKAECEAQVAALKAEVVTLKTQVKTLQDLHFGKPGEKRVSVAGDLTRGRGGPQRPRGQQPGHRGHGRRRHPELPCTEELLSLSDAEACCPVCGLPLAETGLESVSEEVQYEVRLIRKRWRRPQYRRTCQCEGLPRLLCAPLPVRALPQSKYADGFWIDVLLFKYEYQFPLERLIRMLDGHGLHEVASGTLCGGIERGARLLEPLHAKIVTFDRSRPRRLMDESTLKVFVEQEGRATRVWWLWQSCTVQTCVFILDPSRSFDVPSEYLQDTPADGVVCADRYKVYQKLKQSVAFCWAHVRRDFVRLGRSERQSLTWALRWLDRIKRLYRGNRKRVAARDRPEAFAAAQREVAGILDEIRDECDRELASTNWWFNDSRRKVLESLKHHRQGLALFLTDPDIPLDTNLAERLFRPLATFRKNCFGVHSPRFGQITAMMLSIFATLRLNGVYPRFFLTEYFAAVASAGGKAERIVEEFLPWDLPPERRERLVRRPAGKDTS